MPPDDEPLNPYESPATVATRDAARARRQTSQRFRDLKNQSVGFAVMFATAIMALAVGFGTFSFGDRLEAAGMADWFAGLVMLLGGLLMLVGALTALTCGVWTLASVVGWLTVAVAGYLRPREVDE